MALVPGDTLHQALAQRLAFEFASVLYAWLGDDKYQEVLVRNRSIPANCCASHDFCDANMAMHEAFINLFGREPDLESEAHLSLWNRAWPLFTDGYAYPRDDIPEHLRATSRRKRIDKGPKKA
jgi:hypothetical protein